MEITYLGHSCFKLKGKSGTVITDPYDSSIGLVLPKSSADIITVSHQHSDHNSTQKIAGTTKRPKPFIVQDPGEYEIGGISVFGTASYHDDKKGEERGVNTIFTVLIDDLMVCHLGDLGHELNDEQLQELGTIDVLLIPVGGHYTIDPKTAIKVIQQIEPTYIIPMHYQTSQHGKLFADVLPIDAFLKAYGKSPTPQPKLVVDKTKLPEEAELVVLQVV